MTKGNSEPQMSEAYQWRGRTMVDREGDKIGKIDEIYVDEQSRLPEWALVNTGLFGTKSSFVPLAGASPTGEDVRVDVDKERVKGAPQVDTGGELSSEEEAELFRYYGVPYDEGGTVTAEGTPSGTGGRASRTQASRGDDAMTRSEEELHVGTERRERGRARLKKYVVTEEVTQTVPVQREEVRVEREPITDANVDEATAGPDISEAEHEVTLHEEEPVVEKRTVPKERVRLEKDVATNEKQVAEEVRKEQIETEGDVRR
jgi:uncharacterized protein (TIGR02271 family)